VRAGSPELRNSPTRRHGGNGEARAMLANNVVIMDERRNVRLFIAYSSLVSTCITQIA
jgi:hypothetical protein